MALKTIMLRHGIERKKQQLEELRKKGQNLIEYADVGGHKRRIPLDSFEKIMDMRLRETFTILREYLENQDLLRLVNTGVVLCGGGALIPSSPEIMHDVFRSHVRIGEPSGITGAMSAFEYAPACYTAIQGLLKYAADYETEKPESAMDGFRDMIAGLGEKFLPRSRREK